MHSLGISLSPFCLLGMLALGTLPQPSAWSEPALALTYQDFSTDPGWDNYQNRVVGTNMPESIQDFGWRSTSHAAPPNAPGEIGGNISNSRVPASYAMPLGRPLTFDDRISVSGRLALTEVGTRGVSYFGFFNSRRHTWRVYSSMAIRLWEERDVAQVMFDWMSSDWRGRFSETDILIPPDGSVHTFSFVYEPDARPDPIWPDTLLEKHITEETGNMRPIELQGEEFIFERASQDEPGLTREDLLRRLIDARDRGLVVYFHRRGQHRWWKMPNPERLHGRVTLEFNGETPYAIWFDEEIRNSPVELDRFGLFNICRYGTGQTVYFADLIINGESIDLTQNPHWIGANNRASWIEPDFHSMNDFGWTQSNWAGQAPGELGGLLWRVQPEDPGFGYYADEVGTLTLDDPIQFDGQICFVDGMTDASMFFGYFNKDGYMRAPDKDWNFSNTPSMMGIELNDLTAVGYYFGVLLRDASGRTESEDRRHRFLPDRKPVPFSFDYDPDANGGVGRVTYTIGGNEGGFDLSAEQREAGARFDRFGLACVRRGGNSIEIYFDDLTYTVRRNPSAPHVHHEQTVVERPYPVRRAGREF
ncbi:MAG: hypothetical protein KF886_04475 [Candidatus Hydrogenedentes bacterium]|nr:hypothetical protein [Candidatus Hydrogenedentota bacterium]